MLNKLKEQARKQCLSNKNWSISDHADYSACVFYISLLTCLKMLRQWVIDNQKMIPAIVQNRYDIYILLKSRKKISHFIKGDKKSFVDYCPHYYKRLSVISQSWLIE